MVIFLALYAFGGLILAGLSVPLVLQKIPPNGIFGFPVRSVHKDPTLWYRVNTFAGRRFIMAGLGTSAGAIILYYTSSADVRNYALSCLGVFLAFFFWGFITSFLYMRSLQR